MTSRGYLLLGMCVFLAGCGGPKAGKGAAPPAPQANTAILEPRLLQERPKQPVLSLGQLKEAADDQEVVFEGRVPPATTKPFLQNRAVFKLMSREDLGDPKIKEELECEDADT